MVEVVAFCDQLCDGRMGLGLTHNVIRCYNTGMIRSIKSKETDKIFHRTRSRKLPGDIRQIALRKLRMLHRARTLKDLRVPPANRLERLKGARTGQHGIRINDQWRVCFRWQSGGALDVEIVGYN